MANNMKLSKYTRKSKAMNWKEIVMLDGTPLVEKGVSALRTRRKMDKNFAIVRKQMEIGLENMYINLSVQEANVSFFTFYTPATTMVCAHNTVS
jgi:hypothetical protein